MLRKTKILLALSFLIYTALICHLAIVIHKAQKAEKFRIANNITDYGTESFEAIEPYKVVEVNGATYFVINEDFDEDLDEPRGCYNITHCPICGPLIHKPETFLENI